MRSRALLFCLTLSAPATGAAAQVTGTLDMGAGTYRPDRAIAGGIASIVPSLRYRIGSLELGAVGVYSDAPAGRWNFEGGTSALLRSAPGLFQVEVIGDAGWTTHYRVRGTTEFSGGVRGYLNPGSRTRLWLGRHLGLATTLGTRRPLRRNEFGGSARLGAVHLQFSVANTTVDRSLLLGDAGPREDTLTSSPLPNTPQTSGESRRVDRIALTDAVVSGRWRISSLDLDASLGRRFSRYTPETTIWGVSVARSISPAVALVAAAGRAGSDPVTSVPGARYFALGLRLKVGAQPIPALPARVVSARTASAAPFRIGPPSGAGREILVQAVAEHTVELAGDFTDWKTVTLHPWGDDAWRAMLPISPGLHRLAIRIDGGTWRAPAGTRPIASEFGGEVAEVVVE